MSRAHPLRLLFAPGDLSFMLAVARLRSANPFSPERVAAELAALGESEGETEAVAPASRSAGGSALDGPRSADRVRRIVARLERVLPEARDRIADGVPARPEELAAYVRACLYFLQVRQDEALQAVVDGAAPPASFYQDLAREYAALFAFPRSKLSPPAPAHLFAVHVQMRHAHHVIASTLIGDGAPMARLRADVWCSIFTADIDRYVRSLYARLDAVHLLITGPTGTGKEVVARAVALCRYAPFDPDKLRFTADPAAGFHIVNVGSLSESLIESELFGHARGAFTGAVTEKKGWLEVCGPGGCIFLDEIGELAPAVQVKLLRVLQEGTFVRAGDTTERRFQGKIIAATHRDLARKVEEGTFRRDLYYRLVGDRIVTPSLREQLDASPGALRPLILHLAAEAAGPEEAESVADQVEAWIHTMPAHFPWTGNVRELQQCITNVVIRSRYDHKLAPRPSNPPPAHAAPASSRAQDAGEGDGRDDLPPESRDEAQRFAEAFEEGLLTTEEVVVRQTTIVHAQTGNCRETARRLGVDWRTVQRRVDPELLAKLLQRRGKGKKGSERR